MLYREIIAVCSQIHTKHINTLCGQNVELLNVKLAVHSDHLTLKCSIKTERKDPGISHFNIVISLRAGRLRILVRFHMDASDFCLLQNVQSGPGIHQASCSVYTGSPFLRE